MTTVTTPPPVPPVPPQQPPGLELRVGAGRQWRAGWRIALRLGRRDAWRHRGRSTLVVLMVAIPVLLLVGGNILAATSALDPVERLPFQFGQAAARVTYYGGTVTMLPENSDPVAYDQAKSSTPLPGWGPDQAAQVAALGRLTGGSAIPVQHGAGVVTVGRSSYEVQILGVDAGRHPETEGLTRLISGRWPQRADEVVVTRLGVSKGLPTSGTMTGTDPSTGVSVPLTVVGVGEGWLTHWNQVTPADLVSLPVLPVTMGEPAFLLVRDAPVTWPEVERWAAYGLGTASRAVVLSPPPHDQVHAPADLRQRSDGEAAAMLVATAVAAIGLLLETTLLVGPAFAVSATRSRRTLALAASNGATPAQLRRTVLGQALVLGVLSVAVGTILGIAAAWGFVQWSRGRYPDQFFGPFDLPAWPLAIVVGCAVASTLIAALVPSRGLGRLDIIGVLRGQAVSPPARARVPIAGLLVAGLGVVLILVATALDVVEDQPLIASLAAMLGVVLLVVGALLTVPMLLVWLGRLGARAPAAARMALRDAARQRGRATSTVAAILGGTALATIVLVLATSVNSFAAQTYQPQIPIGQAVVHPRPGPMDDNSSRVADTIVQTVAEVAPGLTTGKLYAIWPSAAALGTGSGTAAPEVRPVVMLVRTGCTPADAVGLESQATAATRCASLGTANYGPNGMIYTADLPLLTAQFGLSGEQADVLRRGGMLVTTEVSKESDLVALGPDGTRVECCKADITDGTVTVAQATLTHRDDSPPSVSGLTSTRVPALSLPIAQLNRGGPSRDIGALVTTDTAQRLGWPLSVRSVVVLDPRGPVSEADAQALTDAMTQRALGYFYVERGFQPFGGVIAAVILGLLTLVILTATLLATALSTAEMQPLMGTFAAVGATRTTRRHLAAAQAGSLGAVGAVVGVLVGLVPGIALARLWTSGSMLPGQDPIGPVVEIPWLQLLVPVLAIPAVAAALAWLAIRRDPTVTRRMT